MSQNGPIVNPLYMKPFSLGWTREVVRRGVTRDKTPNCDIYYISPSKKKFRSMNEIRGILPVGLDIECFTFKKEPLGLDPELETIRDAKTRKKGAEIPIRKVAKEESSVGKEETPVEKGLKEENSMEKGEKNTVKIETSEQETEGDKKEEEKEDSEMNVVENENKNTVGESSDVKKESEVNADTKSRRGKPDGKECNESKKNSGRKEKAKPGSVVRSVRLQSLRTKKILRRVRSAKQAKQTKVVPSRKILKKIISKKMSGPRRKLSKSPNVKKPGLKSKKISVNSKPGTKPLKSRMSKGKSEGAKESGSNESEKKARDLKSIVQKNIGKYRELREKQKLGKVTNQVKSPSRNLAVARVSRGGPISENLTYLKPLEKGWKRELVYRSNSTKKGQMADVYYFHPSGKKLRSCREIAENLTHGLSMDCFTFRKEPIGCGEPSEIIRNARPIKRTDTAERGKN